MLEHEAPEESTVGDGIPNGMVLVSEIEYLMMLRRYSTFWPKSKNDLLMDYPELRKVKSFADIDNPRKMLFVYFYACRISPIVRVFQEDSKRIEAAMKEAWGKRIPKEIKDAYMQRDFGDEIANAIEDMRAYIPEGRVRMKLLFMRALERVQELMDGDTSKLKDWDDIGKYFKAMENGTELLKKLLPLAEERALGVTEAEDEEDDGEYMEIFTREDRMR